MMKSTMNAPLTDEEECRIIESWLGLKDLMATILDTTETDPVEMLNTGTALTRAIWELRRAIDDAWHNANKRAFPDPPRKVRREPITFFVTSDDLKALGITKEDVEAILEEKSK